MPGGRTEAAAISWKRIPFAGLLHRAVPDTKRRSLMAHDGGPLAASRDTRVRLTGPRETRMKPLCSSHQRNSQRPNSPAAQARAERPGAQVPAVAAKTLLSSEFVRVRVQVRARDKLWAESIRAQSWTEQSVPARLTLFGERGPWSSRSSPVSVPSWTAASPSPLGAWAEHL